MRVELPGFSIPGTNKGAKPGEMGGDWKRASTGTVAGFLWLGPPLCFFFLLSVFLLNMKKNVTLKRRENICARCCVFMHSFRGILAFCPTPPNTPVNEEA